MIELKKFLIITFAILGFLSCSNKDREYYLLKGLEGYKKQRFIGEDFVKGYDVKKIAFFEESDTISYALLLEENVEAETVSSFNLGLFVYPKDSSLLRDKSFLSWDSAPYLKQFGPYKYILGNFRQPLRRIDSLAFFLYDRDQFNGVKGNVIRLKNLSL